MNRPSSLITIALVLLVAFATFNIIFQHREKKVEQIKEFVIEDVKIDIIEEKEEAGPMVALVLDDFGYSKKNLEKLKDIGVPITMAVLPNVPYSKKACDFAEANGFEVILHMPMEPMDNAKSMEQDTILIAMDDPAVENKIDGALSSVYSAKGISNHMGSRATGDKRLMDLVFSDLKKRELFFLDSYTSANSLCEKTAKEKGVAYAKRDIFIDNELNGEYITVQMVKLEDLAKEKGQAVGIGHDRRATVEALGKIVPQMKKRGIRFVKLSELIEKSEN